MPTSTAAAVGGWTVLAGVAATVWYLNQKRRPTNVRQTGKAQLCRKEPKPKKARTEGGKDAKGIGKDEKKPLKEFKANQDILAPVSANVVQEDEVDNREFARQLTNAKAGTVITSKSKAGPRQKSVKQSRAQEKQSRIETSSDNNTNPSSVTGGDADDDTSSVNSAETKATNTLSPVTMGISDMLEKPAPGLSILRLTEPTNPPPIKRPKVQSSPQSTETKKQRQNRKKAEMNKQMVEEAEKERKRLMEQQRRTARKAEGRPAKDGSGFMASQAPSSAWAATKSTGAQSIKTEHVPLLDTFASSSNQQEQSSPEEKSSEGQLKSSEWANLPSEEEQLRYSIQESQNWEIVKGKEKKSKKAQDVKDNTQDDKNTQENSSIGIQQPRSITPKSNTTTDEEDGDDYAPPKDGGVRSGPGQIWHTTVSYVKDGKSVEKEVELVDSEWEVS